MSVTCPRGHSSASTDYCDVCGALIAPSPVPAPASGEEGSGSAAVAAGPGASGAAEMGAAPAAGADPAEPGVACPRCGTVNPPAAVFCEDCGLNFSDPGASLAATQPPPAAAAGGEAPPGESIAATASSGWQARVVADRAYFDRTDASEGEITFPAQAPERLIPLPSGEVTIGRRSHSSGVTPTIDLAGPPDDIGVSHAHATLAQAPDGVWTVTDLNSTNGTFIGDADTPIAPGQPVAVSDMDEIHLGAWTTITLSKITP